MIRHKQLNLEKIMVNIRNHVIRICRKEFHKTKTGRTDDMLRDDSHGMDGRTYIEEGSVGTAYGNCMSEF
jgi:spermidine synthase